MPNAPRNAVSSRNDEALTAAEHSSTLTRVMAQAKHRLESPLHLQVRRRSEPEACERARGASTPSLATLAAPSTLLARG